MAILLILKDSEEEHPGTPGFSNGKAHTTRKKEMKLRHPQYVSAIFLIEQ
jgi:hypothetical protein